MTVAGCIDILRLCFHTKNQLESVKSLTSVNKCAAQLDEALTKYCRTHSILAEALAGNAAFPAGGTEAEKIANLYRQQTGQKLRLTYTVVRGDVLDQVVSVKQIETREHFKEVFTRLKHFGETCQQQVYIVLWQAKPVSWQPHHWMPQLMSRSPSHPCWVSKVKCTSQSTVEDHTVG